VLLRAFVRHQDHRDSLPSSDTRVVSAFGIGLGGTISPPRIADADLPIVVSVSAAAKKSSYLLTSFFSFVLCGASWSWNGLLAARRGLARGLPGPGGGTFYFLVTKKKLLLISAAPPALPLDRYSVAAVA
jgi:hypothetical protein